MIVTKEVAITNSAFLETSFITRIKLCNERNLFESVNELPCFSIISPNSRKLSFLLTTKAVESVNIEIPIDKSDVAIVNIKDRYASY